MPVVVRMFLVVTLVGLAVTGLGAQSSNSGAIPYVDMSTAQTLVDTLLKENESLAADSADIKKQVIVLTEQITAARKGIDDFQPLMDEVRARIAELATLMDQLVDRGLRARALNAADTNRASQKKVQQRLDELTALAINLPKQIETLVFQMAVDAAKIARNNDDIVLLQATISRTKIQEARLNSLLADIDATSSKIDRLLQQTSVKK